MRRCLQPSCVADLITQQTWKMKGEEAPRKTLDLLRPGVCAIGDAGDNWFQPAGRFSMIDVLNNQERSQEFDKEDYSWWDRFRFQAGSPFDPHFDPTDLDGFRLFYCCYRNPPFISSDHRKGASYRLAISKLKAC